MRIFTEQTLKEYAESHPDAKTALQEWAMIAKRSKWTCFADIKKTFNSVDNVGNQHYYNVLVCWTNPPVAVFCCLIKAPNSQYSGYGGPPNARNSI